MGSRAEQEADSRKAHHHGHESLENSPRQRLGETDRTDRLHS